MNKLATLVKWDIKVQVRYGLYHVYAILSAVYIFALLQLKMLHTESLIIYILFTDTALLGYFFIGGLILYEKNEHTIDALVVTPISAKEYLISKVISLTVLATLTSFVIVLLGYGINFSIPLFAIALIMTSIFFILVGFSVISSCHSLNDYMVKSIFFMVPFTLPFIDFLGFYKSSIFYLFPAQASLILLYSPFAYTPPWKLVYAFIFLTISIVVAYNHSKNAFIKNVVESNEEVVV